MTTTYSENTAYQTPVATTVPGTQDFAPGTTEYSSGDMPTTQADEQTGTQPTVPISKGATYPTPTSPSREGTGSLVLIADDQVVMRRALRRCLETAGYKVLEASTGRQAISMMSENVAVAILDLYMGDVSGFECISHIRRRFADTQVLVTSASGDMADAVRAMNQGAYQCIGKPLNEAEVLAQLHHAVFAFRMSRENRWLRQVMRYPSTSTDPLSNSAAMRPLRKQLEAMAKLDSPVLITGERGTGKTCVAQWLHHHGTRSSRSLVSIDCASMPQDSVEAEMFGHTRGAFPNTWGDRPGRIEIANGGTLLLENVDCLSLELQSKLLAFLQSSTVGRIGAKLVSRINVRIIATATGDLESACRAGWFRDDLHFHLNVMAVQLPSLRDDVGDIPDLATEMLRRAARRQGCPPPVLSGDAIQALQRHDWPENLRELEDVLQRALGQMTGSIVRAEDLTLGQRSSSSQDNASGQSGLAGMTMAEIERRAVIETIRYTGGNKAKAARQLEISEKTIYNKIKQYNLTGKI